MKAPRKHRPPRQLASCLTLAATTLAISILTLSPNTAAGKVVKSEWTEKTDKNILHIFSGVAWNDIGMWNANLDANYENLTDKLKCRVQYRLNWDGRIEYNTSVWHGNESRRSNSEVVVFSYLNNKNGDGIIAIGIIMSEETRVEESEDKDAKHNFIYHKTSVPRSEIASFENIKLEDVQKDTFNVKCFYHDGKSLLNAEKVFFGDIKSLRQLTNYTRESDK